ncbi:hypothetical protein [Nocardioides plantarum]|uniref:DUF1963 domain-containing protein n=1 Tax=Nocardioides plantarum TaxID=29299 RepID=A0ABV5KFL3_9ACTN|nr:hypothetical protein [Nocardioides plantarum]
MTQLLIHAGEADPASPALRTGGLPLAPAGFAWPSCETCDGAMQFLAHLPSADGLAVSVFMCQNDPGMCDEWDPAAGGNSAHAFSGALVPLTAPARGETTLGAVSAARVDEVAQPSYGDARTAWAEQHGVSPRQVLGSLGGEPQWIQGDETPTCPSCASPMPFVAHLEEGADDATGINLGGGGLGYVFACTTHETATFLWQC